VPTTTTLGLFALAALALIAVPGPNLVYIAARSMHEGRRAGLVSAAGLLTGTAINVAAAAAGLSALIASSAVAFDVVRYAGAAYLVILGVRTLRGRGGGESAPAGPAPLRRTYGQAVVVQLLNPKVTLFFLTFLPQFVDPARGSVATQILVLGAILGTLGFAADCLYALAASSAARRMGGWRNGRTLMGAVYVALGTTAAAFGGRAH
jgi:threonine/homoserine/homoserine lactone efflux protein